MGMNTKREAHSSMTPQNIDAQTVLTAVSQGDIQRLRNALAFDATLVNSCEAMGNSAMHIAAWNLDLEAVKVLLSHGADVNAQGHFGAEPIHAACDVRQVKDPEIQTELLGRLIAHGADVNATNRRYRPSRSLASSNFISSMRRQRVNCPSFPAR
jgi:ankyrin repeat protein